MGARTPDSKDYALKKMVQIWEKVRDLIYIYYDVDENTMIIINGDRASWFRKGTEYVPNALYQVDRYRSDPLNSDIMLQWLSFL